MYNEIYRKAKKKVDKQTGSNFKGRGALVAFPKMHLSERQGEPLLFGTFNIIISYIEIEISQSFRRYEDFLLQY